MTKPKLIGESYMSDTGGSKRKRYGIYECPQCKKHWETLVYSVESGATKRCRSCSISNTQKIHGMSSTLIYNTWKNILQRCLDSSSKHYENYGKRGITVCERWMYFENFYEDMGDPPNDDMSINRIDNNGPYSKENCRWATRKEQQRNRRDTIYLTDNSGVTKPLTEWAEIKNISADTMRMRYFNSNWSEHEMIHGR
jgi:hypothetical protein